MQEQDSDTWEDFYKRYEKILREAIYRGRRLSRQKLAVPIPEHNEDLTAQFQGVFFDKFRTKFKEFRGVRQFEAFILQTACYFLVSKRRDIARDREKQAKAQEKLGIPEKHGESGNVFGNSARQEGVQRALSHCLLTLDSKIRVVLKLHFEREDQERKRMTHKAVAEHLQIQEGTASKRFSRGKKLLFECMKRFLEENGYE